jgi:hypothetical protein
MCYSLDECETNLQSQQLDPLERVVLTEEDRQAQDRQARDCQAQDFQAQERRHLRSPLPKATRDCPYQCL